MMIRNRYAQALVDLAQDHFYQWRDMQEKAWEYTHLAKVRTSKQAYEFAVEFAGLPGQALTPENQGTTFVDPIQGGTAVAVHLEYRLGTEVSNRMIEDDRIGLCKQIPQMHEEAAKFTREQVFFNFCFNNGFTTSTGCDGVSVYNSAHPLLGGSAATALLPLPSTAFNTAGTYPNAFATPLAPSTTAVQNMMTIMNRMVDGLGKPIVGKLKKIIHPQEQQVAWKVILGSSYVPNSANNDINAVLMYGLETFMPSYLTSTTYWFAAADKEDCNMILYERQGIEDEYYDKPEVRGVAMQTSQIISVFFPYWYNTFGSQAT